MVDKVTVPTARASILWLIGEYSERINKLAPDVLRKMAKTFPDEVCFQDFLVLNFQKFSFLGNNS
jgi:AP-3 complex subunit beta